MGIYQVCQAGEPQRSTHVFTSLGLGSQVCRVIPGVSVTWVLGITLRCKADTLPTELTSQPYKTIFCWFQFCWFPDYSEQLEWALPPVYTKKLKVKDKSNLLTVTQLEDIILGLSYYKNHVLHALMIPPKIQMCLMAANSVIILVYNTFLWCIFHFKAILGITDSPLLKFRRFKRSNLNGQHSSPVYWRAEAGMKCWLWSHQH